MIGTFRDGTFSDGTFSDGTCCMRTHVTTGQPTYNKQNGGKHKSRDLAVKLVVKADVYSASDSKSEGLLTNT